MTQYFKRSDNKLKTEFREIQKYPPIAQHLWIQEDQSVQIFSSATQASSLMDSDKKCGPNSLPNTLSRSKSSPRLIYDSSPRHELFHSNSVGSIQVERKASHHKTKTDLSIPIPLACTSAVPESSKRKTSLTSYALSLLTLNQENKAQSEGKSVQFCVPESNSSIFSKNAVSQSQIDASKAEQIITFPPLSTEL